MKTTALISPYDDEVRFPFPPIFTCFFYQIPLISSIKLLSSHPCHNGYLCLQIASGDVPINEATQTTASA
jgi:hypothetical protein